ncbi:MAG: aspartate aminotransferase family protein [Bacteroidales bacterium]
MNKTNQSFHESDHKYYLQTFKRYPLVLESAEGSKVWDVEGNEYIDLLAGIAVNSVGHCHPAVVKEIVKQASKLIHISNFYLSEPQFQLSKKLTELSGLERVFLTNSGAESVEGAIKIARKYAHSRGKGGTIISFDGCFHGRTLGTIATGKKQMQEGFEPIPVGFKQAKFNDISSVIDASDSETAAVIVEPIQGEGGINVANPEFLEELRVFCNQQDIVLIFDEIQCGMGRTGKMFAKDIYGVQPDIMTLAKALGGGMPIGAILSNEKVSSAIDFGDHGTTFGGNPLASSAALATIAAIETENMVQQAAEKGEWLKKQVESMNLTGLKEVRGPGLMKGLEFEFETKPLVLEMLNKGVLANATAGNVLRLVPPLNISYEDLEAGLLIIKQSLETINGKK